MYNIYINIQYIIYIKYIYIIYNIYYIQYISKKNTYLIHSFKLQYKVSYLLFLLQQPQRASTSETEAFRKKTVISHCYMSRESNLLFWKCSTFAQVYKTLPCAFSFFSLLFLLSVVSNLPYFCANKKMQQCIFSVFTVNLE